MFEATTIAQNALVETVTGRHGILHKHRAAPVNCIEGRHFSIYSGRQILPHVSEKTVRTIAVSIENLVLAECANVVPDGSKHQLCDKRRKLIVAIQERLEFLAHSTSGYW